MNTKHYILTLDSHDYWGPFETNNDALDYGKAHFSTWTIVTKISDLCVVLKPIAKQEG